VLDHLLDRDNESEKAGLQWKYAVLAQLHDTARGWPAGAPSAAATQAYEPYRLRVEWYLRDGAFFRPAGARVEDTYL